MDFWDTGDGTGSGSFLIVAFDIRGFIPSSSITVLLTTVAVTKLHASRSQQNRTTL
jgi:hypothetical protein